MALDRNDIAKMFYDWFKRQNLKSGYNDVFKIENLIKWDADFFDNQLFNIDESECEEFINKISNLVYGNQKQGWKELNEKSNKGAPQAILGKNNYLAFLRENFDLIQFEKKDFFTLKTNTTSIELISENGTNEFEFARINWHFDKIKKGDLAFFVQRGDKPVWDSGLSAICEITDEPYDLGYDPDNGKNFKIKLKVLFILPKVLDRADFVGFRECYDLTHIGPMTKNEPNQAISIVSNHQAKSLINAIVELLPDLKESLSGARLYFESTELKSNESKYILSSSIQINKILNQRYNLILYGAPGTGKSHELNKRVNHYFPNEILRTRITFHPNYNYRNFVGTYKPSPLYKNSEIAIYSSKQTNVEEERREPVIDYVFEPGPFIQSFLKAYHNPKHNFVVIIEELNRANAPAVFGELFQLLDREPDGSSTYSVRLEESAMKYLRENDVNDEEIRIPKNLYIWATMNNADQGVLPLDSAFKRRWSFEHIGLNDNEEDAKGYINFKFIPPGKQLIWNKFRRELNTYLIETLKIHEDKLIAPFFLREHELNDENAIKNKLLLYLKEDVLKYKDGLFNAQTFSQICETYNKGGMVFNEDFGIENHYIPKDDVTV